MKASRSISRSSLGPGAALAVLALLGPKFVYSLLLVNFLCFALYACGYNLLIGYTRYVSFGHSAFVGTSAYVTGYVLTHSMPTESGFSPASSYPPRLAT